MPIDRAAPVTFLQTAFHEDDWVAVFLKSYQSGRVAQRVRPVQQIQGAKFQAWLRAENAAGANIYVSVNTLAPDQRSRRRDSVREIRHVFLDADSAAQEVLDAIETTALPSPSYVMRSSPGRAHLFWRVNRFTSDTVEALERHLARKLGTDPAATACTQVTRLPGFVNHKRATPYLISIEYGDTNRLYEPTDFPKPPPRLMPPPLPVVIAASRNAVVRARQYVAAIPPAISGQHGDVHTFRVCCRVIRGFALADDEALDVLREWNSRCEPPWSDRELMEKLSRAHRYGREPIGSLLEERP